MIQSIAAPVIVYGAGGMGSVVAKHLAASGNPPVCLIDQRATQIGNVDGVPVLELAQAAELYVKDSIEVLVANHSFGFPVSVIASQVKAAGFTRVSTLWDYVKRSGWSPERPFWLAPDLDWAAHRTEMKKVRDMLVDERSREIFDEQWRLRSDGNYAGLSAAEPRLQYAPDDVPRWQDPLNVVDCGGFTGDTLRAWVGHGYRISQAIVLEPDPRTFPALETHMRESGHGRAIRAGVGDHDGMMAFAAGPGGASHVDPQGGEAIQVLRIDTICAAFHPNLIKMDIEGAERAALCGAEATLRRDRPGLAISIYHQPDDLWKIPLQIAAYDLDYCFYVRSHGNNGFDTVLYALPS